MDYLINSLMESVSMEIEDENDAIDVENETSSSDQDSSMVYSELYLNDKVVSIKWILDQKLVEKDLH